MSAGSSIRGLLVALGIAALGLPLAIVGLFGVVSQIDLYNTSIARVREAQLSAAQLQRLQSDEEDGVRGFAATGDPVYLNIYRAAARAFPQEARTIADRLSFGGDDRRATQPLNDAIALNARWRQEVAAPALAKTRERLNTHGASAYIVRIRNDIGEIGAVLVGDYRRQIIGRAGAIKEATWIAVGSLFVVALQIVVYGFVASRLRGELARERRVVAVLQTAFSSEIVNDERLDVAATYVSATRGAKVGGDVYDIFPLDANRTLVVIADVSGKGVEAAVDSTFVKYGLRAFASEHADIATIISRFSGLYERAHKLPEAFVVVFAGILDHRSRELSYVNAGHEAAYVRRPQQIEQLAPTGPIVGVGVVADSRFVAARTWISSDDVLFLSTDGLTEARDPAGNFLGGAGVEEWLRDSDASTAQSVVDFMARRLKRYTRDRSTDDLAIMAVRLKISRTP
jgi:CHASE3 domain sensor protein